MYVLWFAAMVLTTVAVTWVTLEITNGSRWGITLMLVIGAPLLAGIFFWLFFQIQ